MPEPDRFITFTCPACGGRIHALRSAAGSHVECPKCEATVLLKDPTAYQPMPMIVDPKIKMGFSPRGENAPVDTAAFKDRLRRTSEDTYKVDPDQPVMKRRDFRKQKHGAAMTEWDTNPRRAYERKGPRRLILFMSVASLVLLLSLGGIFWYRLQHAPVDSSPTVRGETPLELKPVGDFRDEVWEVVQRFCAAPNPEALLPLIREPERVGPNLLKYYQSGNQWNPLALSTKPDLANLEVHRSFVVLPLPLADFSQRPIALEQTPEGFRVDWESFTGYSEISWADLRRTRPREPVLLRAVIRLSDYFNFDFPSSTTHRCFQLSDQSGENILYGYVPLDSDVEMQIKKIQLTAPSVHAVIKVRYPTLSTSNRQVEITEVLEKGWIFREDDLPEPTPVAAPALELNQLPVQSSPGAPRTRAAVLPGLSSP